MRIQAAVSREGQPFPVIEEVDLEDPRPGEIRVRITATGICHTDLSCHSGRGMPVPRPVVLGHEGAGVVEAVGEAVTSVEVGDHVVLSGASCGDCPSCRAARPMYCRDGVKLTFSAVRVDGSSPLSQNGKPIAGAFFGQSSFATHAIASARSATKVPKELPLDLLGPLGCGIITGAGSVIEALRVRPGQSIAIFGAGSVGLAAVMAARIAGARRIAVVDINPGRLRLAEDLGATDTVVGGDEAAERLKKIEPFGFDFTFNNVTMPSVHLLALNNLAKEGTAGFVARAAGAFNPPMTQMLSGGHKMQGILGGNAVPQLFIPLMIDYWRKGMFPFDKLVTRFDFADIGEAWKACESGDAIKPVLMIGEPARAGGTA